MASRALSGWIALAVLALASLAWVASGSSSTESRVSVTSGAAGQCSLAEASAAVDRLVMRDISAAQPVFKVLCGSFTGAGSRTMVASIFGPENVGLLYWAVFRWTGGEWQLVLKRRQAAVLTAAGPDIRETVSIYRAGDPRCCPSGGNKSRIWHWNGSRLLAGPWKQVTKGEPERVGYFKTPSGNIVCVYGIYTGSRASESSVGCRIKWRLQPNPPGTPPGCWTTGDLLLRATGRPIIGRTICPGDDEGDAGVFVYESRARVLAYGKTWNGGGLRCASATTGLTCRSNSGHGFFLSRERWRTF